MNENREILAAMRADAARPLREEVQARIPVLLGIAESADTPEESLEAMEILDQILHANASVHLVSLTSGRLRNLGMNAYLAKQFHTAEIAFRLLAESGDIKGCNNLAYMMRRGEVPGKAPCDPVRVLRLLRKGTGEQEPFSMANTALTLALMLGTDADWCMADDLFRALPKERAMSVRYWWSLAVDLKKEIELEGWLVHFFLLRHQKIESSPLGSLEEITLRLKRELPGFSVWLDGETERRANRDLPGIPSFLKRMQDRKPKEEN